MKNKSRKDFLLVVLAVFLTALFATSCLSPANIENRIKRARKEIASQKANLESAEKNLDQAEHALKRARENADRDRKAQLQEADERSNSAWEKIEGGRFSVRGYKPIFGIIYSEDKVDHNAHGDDRQAEEALFNISFKVRLLDDYPVYFGYTQKSFFQVYDKKRSRPFREHNFNPEGFLDIGRATRRGKYALQIGFEHESNGRGFELDKNGEVINNSRSWNRVYIHPKVRFSNELLIALKIWERVDRPDAPTDQDPIGDDNPNIEKFLGSGELRVYWRIKPKYALLTMFRKGQLDRHGTAQLDFLFPVPRIKKFFFQVQYFNGFGESLIDHDHRVRKIGLGLATGNPLAGLMPAR